MIFLRILAIETSCDETAAAVVQNGRSVLSSVVASQIEQHKIYGGVVPEIASRLHTENICFVVEKALAESGCSLDDIDAFAVTCMPGLIGALLVGVNFAKGLSIAKQKPIIGVNHIKGHIAACYIENSELKPPFLALVVSGGHSHIIEVADFTEFEVIGRTRDDAAGEAFDKVARTLGLSYPGGVHIERLSATGDPNSIVLPSPKLDTPYDFSFSGLKTAVINIVHNSEQKGEKIDKANIAAAFQQKISEILIEKLLKAAMDRSYKKIVISGGVSANSIIRSMAKEKCREKGLDLYIPSPDLCGDNAAMIGVQGYYEYLAGNISAEDLNANSTKL